MNNQPHPTTPEHRKQVLDRLAEIWAEHPHLRLGQLVANLARPRDGHFLDDDYQARWRRRIFNVYDLDLVNESLR